MFRFGKGSTGEARFGWIAKMHAEGKLPVRKAAPEIIEHETPTDAAARRAAEFRQLTNPAPVVVTRELILRGIALSEGLQTFDPPPQPEPQRPRTPSESAELAKAIVAAYDRSRGKA